MVFCMNNTSALHPKKVVPSGGSCHDDAELQDQRHHDVHHGLAETPRELVQPGGTPAECGRTSGTKNGDLSPTED